MSVKKNFYPLMLMAALLTIGDAIADSKEQKNPPKASKSVKKQSAPVIDYPVEKVRAGGYIYGKGLTFVPGEKSRRAPWLKKDTPTTFLTYSVPLNGSEWTPSFMEYQVKGEGTALTVFESYPVQRKPTWTCLKDLKAFVNGKEIECKWPLMGLKRQDKDGKTYYVISQKKHIHTAIPVKDGDKLRIEWSARPAVSEDVK